MTKLNIWIPINLIKLVKKHGNVFPTSVIKEELDLQQASVSQFLTESRTMGFITTKRREDDLRTTNVIVDKKTLNKYLLTLKETLENRIDSHNSKVEKYQLILGEIWDYLSHEGKNN